MASSPVAPLAFGALRERGAVLLISCYELGHQPLGLAWPRAFLERAGFAPDSIDVSIEPLDEAKVRRARLAVIAVPMHTALRIGTRVAEQIRRLNAECRIVCQGLYAELNAEHLLGRAADFVLSGESEGALVALAEQLERGERPAARHGPWLERLAFPVPQRERLPALGRYAGLARGGRRLPAGYVEASRGCLHSCRHCPIPPVYGGRFFVVPRDVVLEDVRRLVTAGARHITFGDPDFLNGPGHALKLVRALHAAFPEVTYDCTAKIAHIVRHRGVFAELAATGCLFVVSAVESLSDVVLAELDKGHTRADVRVALDVLRGAGIALRPSLMPFTPWAGMDDYLALLAWVEREGLVDHVDPVQFTIRLLLPPGSLLLSHSGIQPFLRGLDPAGLTYRWTHPDPRMDALQLEVSALVQQAARSGEDAAATFARVRALAYSRADRPTAPSPFRAPPPDRPIPPRLTEPWFC
jgi:radical SAM superfamily enzyme YgiQ (UPF0313 family)